MRLQLLKVHPDNNRIYTPTDLSDLKQSLSSFGQLEPIAVTKDNFIISGHRRFSAMIELRWDECEVRIVQPDNQIISLIEHNRHRQKTASDILNEARFLEKELKTIVGRGRNAAQNRGRQKQGKRLTMVYELSQRLGVGATRLKQLLSISNYEPDLIEKIDRGEISVSKAYEQIKSVHMKKNKTDNQGIKKPLTKLLKEHNPSLDEIMHTLKQTYPYSLELTNVSEDRRMELVEHLERMKKMDSRSLMLVQKQDELEHLDVSPKEIATAKSFLPTSEELNDFWQSDDAISNVKVIVANGKKKCKKTGILLSKQLWNILRVSIHSQEHLDGPGRKMSSYIGFENDNGFRLLGIVSFRSDSHSLKVRDDFIGWTIEQRAKNREHLVNMNVCCPTQPFGHDRLGGKFISLIAEKMIDEWERHYKTRVVAIMTTSLHGSHSQYSGMKLWKNLGTSSGEVLLKPLRDEWSYWRSWLMENHRTVYEEKNSKTSPTQGMLSSVFKFLDIPIKQYMHTHKRGVFVYGLYENYADFLCDEIGENKLIGKERDWNTWWFNKSQVRIKKLKTDKRLSNKQLFHEHINIDELEMWATVRGVG